MYGPVRKPVSVCALQMSCIRLFVVSMSFFRNSLLGFVGIMSIFVKKRKEKPMDGRRTAVAIRYAVR